MCISKKYAKRLRENVTVSFLCGVKKHEYS